MTKLLILYTNFDYKQTFVKLADILRLLIIQQILLYTETKFLYPMK